MSYCVYVLQSKIDGRLYTGMTSNFQRRLRQHNSGKTRSTKSRVPFSVVYTEEVSSRAKARKREVYLKSGAGREFIKQLAN